jgi:hypothetical protein
MLEFGLTLPAGTELYRGLNAQNDPSGNWFVYSLDDAKMYGIRIHKYRLKRDINLINIQHKLFHIDYMNKVNRTFTGQDGNGVDDRRIFALIPFGLPDTKFLIESLTKIGHTPANVDIIEEYISKLTGDTHRYSTYQTDQFMVECMRDFYHHTYDGFTNPIEYISKLPPPGKYKREVYVFDRTAIQFDHEIQIVAPGGGSQPVVFRQPSISFEDSRKLLQASLQKDYEKFNHTVILHDTSIDRVPTSRKYKTRKRSRGRKL